MNLRSITQAIGWSGLFNAFADKNSKKSTYVDLLPFPDELKALQPRSMSTATTEILRQLISTGSVSNKVAAAAIALNPELESALPALDSLPELPAELLM